MITAGAPVDPSHRIFDPSKCGGEFTGVKLALSAGEDRGVHVICARGCPRYFIDRPSF